MQCPQVCKFRCEKGAVDCADASPGLLTNYHDRLSGEGRS